MTFIGTDNGNDAVKLDDANFYYILDATGTLRYTTIDASTNKFGNASSTYNDANIGTYAEPTVTLGTMVVTSVKQPVTILNENSTAISLQESSMADNAVRFTNYTNFGTGTAIQVFAKEDTPTKFDIRIVTIANSEIQVSNSTIPTTGGITLQQGTALVVRPSGDTVTESDLTITATSGNAAIAFGTSGISLATGTTVTNSAANDTFLLNAAAAGTYNINGVEYTTKTAKFDNIFKAYTSFLILE